MKAIAVLVGALAGLLPALALGQASGGAGFYGGVTLRDRDGTNAETALFGKLPASWATAGQPASEEGPRALLFGGYRWRNDVALEAAFNTRESLSLGAEAHSLGLALAEPANRAWNLDLYTSWEMRPTLALYGRFGYGQSEPRTALAGGASIPAADPRRTPREGLNYGVGLRFDLTQSLGLRMEYSRYGRQSLSNLTDALTTGMPESDQLSIGVQFRF